LELSKSGFGLGPTSERFNSEFTVWREIIKPEFHLKADEWLKDLSLSPIENYLSDRGETARTLGIIKHWLSELYEPEPVRLLDDLVIDVELLGEAIEIESSDLGKTVIEALAKAKIVWRWATTPQPETIWQFSEFVFPDLPQDDKTRIEIFHEASQGESVLQYVRIFKNKRGQETVMWFAPQMAANRPMHQITRWYVNNSETGRLEFDEVPLADLGKVMNFGEWSEGIVIPALFKKLVFLAEAGAKALSDSAGDRKTAFAHLAISDLPKPVMFTEKNEWVRSTWHSAQGNDFYNMERYPHVANLGWVLRDKDTKSFAKTFQILNDGLIRVQYALCEGYDSGFLQSWAGTWDVNTLSAMLMVAPEQKTKVNGAGFWTPSLELALQTVIARENYNEASGDEGATRRQSLLETLVHKGVSAASFSAINTYVFSYLFPDKEWVLAMRLLEIGLFSSVEFEALNSLSNMGVAMYIGRDLDAAEEKFKQVLKATERTSDGEAYFYLAAIARARGNEALAKGFDTKCAEAGGYRSRLFDQIEPVSETPHLSLDEFQDDSPNGSLTKSNTGGLSSSIPQTTQPNRAAFCTQCGHKFESSEDNFCIECGAPRQ
jgi:hypothetical protein